MDVVSVENNASGQVINIPENYRLDSDELYIKKVGQVIYLVPKNATWDEVFKGFDTFADDFMENGRGEQCYEVREAL